MKLFNTAVILVRYHEKCYIAVTVVSVSWN